MARRDFLLRALLALATAGLTGCAAPKPESARPIVLVHGAWMGASSWDRVAAELRGRGHAVTAVELPGHGRDPTPAEQLTLAGYVDAVVAALPAQGRAVLVGHSMGGMVISGVAEKAPQRVARLVYVAAYLPASGQSLYQLSMTDAHSQVGKYWQQQDPKKYTPATLKAEGIAPVFCADCSAADQQLLVASHRAEAVPPLGTPLQLSAAAFGSVPRVYVHTTQDQAVSYPLQQAMLGAAGGADRVVTLATSHAPMLTQPQALAEVIAAAAR